MLQHGIPRIADPSSSTPEAKQKELAKIDEYKSLVSQVQKAVSLLSLPNL